MLLSPATSNASLPTSQGFWNRFKTPKSNKEAELREQRQAQLALSRQRLLTLVFDDMETVRMLPNSIMELEGLAREWIKPPPDMPLHLRVPIEYASLHAARLVSGPYIYLTSEDSYQIAIAGVQGLRVEIVCDSPPPPDEPPPPPPPPVLEMPGTFALELAPGQHVALDTTITSDELDMARMEDGTTVDGSFWGKLDIVHDGDVHKMEFSGTRIQNTENVSTDLIVDSRVINKLAVAAKPATAKCHLSILAPSQQYADVILSFSPLWKMGVSWPPAESVPDNPNRVKWFLRVHPGGAVEHFETEMTATSLYYEAIPEPGMLDPHEFIAPRNGFAMSFRDFVPHLMRVLDQLGMSLFARTTFINNNLAAFSAHRNIAYRFMPPSKIAAAIDISVTVENCVFTRLFLMFRGVTDDELGLFSGAGEKEANAMNWRELVGWSEMSKDQTIFRILETSVLEVT
ncbi:hypothetical protein BD309DRAFT_1013767 [Dichomitus squalens]|uniref:uncharacterized protein n=1 Tax=Dichomitus squalens (strain LYAD-421) TaxID=732165 RepID=UPI0004414A39|nr:uncharacterized protein DICSQDRAFT_177306 [Dichomitus squalens LYAD-421 SS1]EJF65896.1 hypothetical protein DICSQDRAFT_177306 [Dichomitus squalens LYAD-421 SS1]TBU50823.1 hypothetical protein BD309DRAFT_1013767 [Dichomitus squalens]